jgi:hypothetical protein
VRWRSQAGGTLRGASFSRVIAALLASILGGMLLLGLVAAPALGQEGEPDLSAPEMESVYDPYRGIDPDGRIPRIDKAALVDRPERWRYIPEGRIKPGNLFQRFLVSSFIVPLFFVSSDVGVGFGAAVTDIDFRKQRRREFLGTFLTYTSEGQQSYVLRWRRWLKHLEVPGGGVLQEERSFVRAAGGYRKTLTRRFFGFGPRAGENDETSYTDQIAFLDIGMSRSLEGAFDDFIVDLGVRGEWHRLTDGKVSGKPDTDVLFPEIFADADLIGLGWLSTGLRWDTRDSQRNPYRGTQVGAFVDGALYQSSGDVAATYRIFADQLFPVWPLLHDGGSEDEEHPPTDSVAFHAETQLSSGDLPFFDRPTLGGRRLLRGYIAGRWRDDALWTAGTEYRFWVLPRGFPVWRHIRVERVGLALFYEAGAVAGNGTELFRARVRHSYGVSLRATIERAAIFRGDFGFSEEGLNIALGFGLAF